MIDKFAFRIPFHADHVMASDDCESGQIDMLKTGIENFNNCEISVVNGKPIIQQLKMSYEALPSSFTPMAMKIHNGGTYWPFVEIKASPAKLLQGHNLYGPDRPVLCGNELLRTLDYSMPQLSDMLDYPKAEIYEIDCTYSFDFRRVELGLPLIDFLSNVSSYHFKAGKKEYDTSIYWKYTSEYERLKCYLKWHELQSNIAKLRKQNQSGMYDHVIEVMTDPKLQQYAVTKARFEANLRHRRLKDLGISNYWKFCKEAEKVRDQSGNLIQQLWQRSFSYLFDAIGDRTVNLHNDEDIKRKLMLKYGKQNSQGKMNYSKALNYFRTYRSIKAEGFEEAKQTMSKSTFYDHIKALVESGISKARLQNIHKPDTSNVIPLIQLIEIDFSNQFPDDYVEPTSNYLGDFSRIKPAAKHYPHLSIVA